MQIWTAFISTEKCGCKKANCKPHLAYDALVGLATLFSSLLQPSFTSLWLQARGNGRWGTLRLKSLKLRQGWVHLSFGAWKWKDSKELKSRRPWIVFSECLWFVHLSTLIFGGCLGQRNARREREREKGKKKQTETETELSPVPALAASPLPRSVAAWVSSVRSKILPHLYNVATLATYHIPCICAYVGVT